MHLKSHTYFPLLIIFPIHAITKTLPYVPFAHPGYVFCTAEAAYG